MRHRLPLLTLCLAYLMVILDATIVNVALPALGRDLHSGVGGLQWTVDAYTLVFAALLLPAGALGDRWGARRLFVGGLIAFTAASAACALAPNVAVLIAARALQGIGAAVLVPTSLALLRATYGASDERARAVGAWGAVAGIGAAFGPVIGGVLVNLLSWRWVFIVNLPVGILAVVLTRNWLPAQGEPEGGGIDPLGQLTVIITLALLALGVIDGGHGKLLSAATLAPLAGAVAGGALFVTIEQRSRAPMLPLALLRNRDISASNLIGLAINFGLYGQLFVFSLYFQRSLGYSALQTGLALLPEGAAVAAGSFFSGRLIARHGPRPVLLGGLLMGSVGFAGLAAVGAHTAYALLVVPLLLTGYGMSTTMPAVTAAVLSAAPGNRAGISAALLNASRQVGSMLGVALLGSVVAAAGIDAGLRITMVIAAAAFLAGLGLGAKLVGRSRALAGVS